MVWYSHLSKSFPVCHDPHKGFSVVNETEIDVFLKSPCFLYNSANVGNLISSFSKPSLDIWKFLVHIMLKASMQDLSMTLLAWEMSAIVRLHILWYYPSWELGWELTFSSPVATAGSSRFADIMSVKPWWHHPFWIVLLEFHHIH